MIKRLKKDKIFFRGLMTLAIPIILQSLVTASLNLLDNLMIGSLGEEEIASVGLANQYYMVYYHTIMGIVCGAGVFMSQFWGRRDRESIHKFLGIALTVGIFASLIYSGGALLLPEKIIHIFTRDAQVTALGAGYLRAVAPSYIFTSVSLAFALALRSTEQTKVPMYGSIIGLLFNGILNYIFIFGRFGIPAMGVTGAALGTTISRGIEMLFILCVIYTRKNIVAGSFRELTGYNIELVGRYFKTAVPIIFNDIMWIMGITAYSVAYARLGTNATATMQIATTINNMFNIFGIGIANAAAIMIGNKIGAAMREEAREDAVKISIFGTLLGCIIGGVFYIIAPAVAGLFKVSPETHTNVVLVLRIMAVVLPVRFFGIVQIIGVLRGGGDVIFSIGTELFAVWGVAVPLAFIGVGIMDVPIYIVYVLVCLEEPFKAAVTIPRLMGGKWIRDLTGSREVTA